MATGASRYLGPQKGVEEGCGLPNSAQGTVSLWSGHLAMVQWVDKKNAQHPILPQNSPTSRANKLYYTYPNFTISYKPIELYK